MNVNSWSLLSSSLRCANVAVGLSPLETDTAREDCSDPFLMPGITRGYRSMALHSCVKLVASCLFGQQLTAGIHILNLAASSSVL